MQEEIKPRLCACGCGQITNIASQSSKRRGWIKGEYFTYIHGHNSKGEKNPFFGKRHSLETRKGRVPWMKGRHHTKYANKKNSEAHKGKIPWNKELTKKDDDRIKATSGSFKEGNEPWNKNRTKEIDERLMKISKENSLLMIEYYQKHPEVKKHLSLTTKKYFQEHPEAVERSRINRLYLVLPRKDTIIECELQNKLKENDISFQTHYPIIGQPDIVIFNNGSKIAVFADGCYWHNCPMCFLNGGYDKKQIDNDKKVSQHLQKEGWIVLRFWEHEIKNNIEGCIQKIKDIMAGG